MDRCQIILPLEGMLHLEMNPDKIPDLHWSLANTYHTTNIGQIEPHAANMSTQCIDVDTLSHPEGNRCGNWCGTTLNTDMTTLQSNNKLTVCFCYL